MERVFYLVVREREGMPRLSSVAAVLAEERAWLPYLVLAELPFKAQGNGLPVQGEFQRVSRLEDGLMEQLAREGALYLGHITFNGSMTVAFHAPRELANTVQLKTGLFKSESFRLEVRHDPAWSWFDSALAPTPIEKELHVNRQLLDLLSKEGDKHAEPRKVDFFAYFTSAQLRDEFAKTVEAEGFLVAPEVESAKAFGCEFSRITPVEETAIAQVCVDVRGLVERFGGDFDGWACPVMR